MAFLVFTCGIFRHNCRSGISFRYRFGKKDVPGRIILPVTAGDDPKIPADNTGNFVSALYHILTGNHNLSRITVWYCKFQGSEAVRWDEHDRTSGNTPWSEKLLYSG